MKILKKIKTIALAISLISLAACQSLPTPPQEPVRFDLGALPPVLSVDNGIVPATLAPVVLADIQAPWQAEGSTTDMHYRLQYDEHQPQALHAYSLASWSQAPEILVQERLRYWLSQGGRVVLSGEGGRIPPYIDGERPITVQFALEEFLQIFATPKESLAQVRLRVTVVRDAALGAVGQELIAQKVFTANPQAPSQDAAGGAKALARAVDEIGQEVLEWLQKSTPHPEPASHQPL